MTSNNSTIRLNVNAAIVKGDQILVIEFNDENGIHYNLPGGGVDVGESLENALIRECTEEATAQVSVGRLILVWEYVPALHGNKYGSRQKIGHVFECKLKNDCIPTMPKNPDQNQTNVKWIPLAEIKSSTSQKWHPLFPTIGDELVDALRNPSNTIHVISRA
jgi:ADP-ribose pyrophosphatase YjhB (NUDIX family)